MVQLFEAHSLAVEVPSPSVALLGIPPLQAEEASGSNCRAGSVSGTVRAVRGAVVDGGGLRDAA